VGALYDPGSHTRLNEIGAVLAERMPSVLDAAITLLESIPPALDRPRPERYEIHAAELPSWDLRPAF